MTRAEISDLNPAIWLWSIPLPLMIHVATRHIDPEDRFFSTWIESEAGFIENATTLLLIPATVFGTILAVRFYHRYGSFFFFWFAGFSLMCLGFAGEEVSWGQHWIGWMSPGYFAEHNRQGETNFHNLNIHFGRVVKTLLTLAIIIGGLILPLKRRRPTGPATDLFDVLVPTMVCVPAAAFVFGVRLVERLKTWFDSEWALLAVNLKELQELYIAIFLLVYVWSLRTRLNSLPAAA